MPRSDEWSKYMKEGMDVSLLKWNGNVISVDVPNTVDLMVTMTDPGVKGNTVSGEHVLDTGQAACFCVRGKGGMGRVGWATAVCSVIIY